MQSNKSKAYSTILFSFHSLGRKGRKTTTVSPRVYYYGECVYVNEHCWACSEPHSITKAGNQRFIMHVERFFPSLL